ncbi:hypothetical protein [Hansschlegelia zhihuaiae]|uniref:hypothetical protein n=1 Tax=Hansschlegelia zhihuaiae TaxID=405005 RepID=UPI0013E8E134|nr:hypothetical protein [Hansschlegelia zhihuaiae]
MEAFLNDVWEAVRPGFLLFIAGLVPVLATWLTAKIVEALKVQKDGELAQSLYRTIDNTLRALVTTLAARGGKLDGLPAGLINDAIEIVKRDNPKAVSTLGQTDDQLRTKIIAKLPGVQNDVVTTNSSIAGTEGAAKVERVAQ